MPESGAWQPKIERRPARAAEDLVHQRELQLAVAEAAELGAEVAGPEPALLHALLAAASRSRARACRSRRRGCRAPGRAARSRRARRRPSSRARAGIRARSRSPRPWGASSRCGNHLYSLLGIGASVGLDPEVLVDRCAEDPALEPADHALPLAAGEQMAVHDHLADPVAAQARPEVGEAFVPQQTTVDRSRTRAVRRRSGMANRAGSKTDGAPATHMPPTIGRWWKAACRRRVAPPRGSRKSSGTSSTAPQHPRPASEW